MEEFFYEEPSLRRKDEAIEFINEFIKNNSNINGTGGLDRYLDDYEGWLVKLEQDYRANQPEGRVPALTYFLVRESDNKIIGMINIRLVLNDYLRRHGGHIGYCIRPSEREKGYNKINLYLGLKVCQQHEVEEALLDADLDNPASWKTMESLGGIRVEEYIDEVDQTKSVRYIIPVDDSINRYKDIYESKIKHY
ncbi:MAG: GNAT family N-acetyltransferase [Bacilli bacterium]|nr:GNAT family N-acetyltransferase [Bacilli bacterium]